jgi:hypothetical protein
MKPDMADASEAIKNSSTTGGARFTEVMEGHMYIGADIEDFNIAVEAAKAASSTAKFFLSVDAWDIKALTCKKNHAAMLTGTFSCGMLSPDPFLVLRGEFQLFSNDERSPDTKNLIYNFEMLSVFTAIFTLMKTSGETFHFNGYKIVDPSIAGSMTDTWKATTTLYATISRPDDSIAGRGILHVSFKNFAHQLLSFQGIGGSLTKRVTSSVDFLAYFNDRLCGSLFAPFHKLQYPTPSIDGFYPQTISTEITLTASDGVQPTMRKWTCQRPQAHNAPILLVPGAAVDHEIFALPTIPFNFVDYLLRHGYTVYCVIHRVGKCPQAKQDWTTFDARRDIAAAVNYIRKESGLDKIYAVTHCAGAVAMAAGLLDGTIQGIGGLTASQVFMTPVFSEINMAKANILPKLTTVYTNLGGHWYDCVSRNHRTLLEKVFDEALRVYPEETKRDICHSVACHRSELVFGRYSTSVFS